MFDAPHSPPDTVPFEQALEHMTDAVVIIGALSQIMFFNAAAEQLCGYRRDEVLGKDVKMLVPREMRTGRDSWLHKQSTGDQAHEVEIARKDGTVVWVALGVSPVTNDQAQVSHVVTLRNITRERDGRLLMARLQAETTDAVVEVNEANLVTTFNDAAEKLWGYRRSDVVGQNVTTLVPSKKYGNFDGFVDRADKGNAKDKIRQVAIYRKDGTIGHARLAIKTDAAEGAMSRYTAVLTDVSKQQALADETLELIRELLTQIAQMTNSINTIAQQTNLLSVNASIEAARAGDMGRGFGVVAMEIRALSNQAREITQQIEGVVEAGHASVAKMADRQETENA